MRDIDLHIENPTEKQWRRLFAAAIQLRDARPWDTIWDSDIFRIDMPGYDMPVFCSIMGIIGECYGVNIYPGYEAFLGYLRMADAKPTEPKFVSLNRQNCISCFFGDKKEITEQDSRVYESLDLTFKGPHQWVYFRETRPGFQPWYIGAQSADILAETLEQLYIVVRQFERGNIMDAHLKEKMVWRHIAPDTGQWVNEAIDFSIPDMQMERLIVDDELFIAQLNHQKRVGASLEIDILYFPTPIQETPENIPYFPQMGFLMDAESGELLAQHVLNPNEDEEEDIAVQLLISYIFEIGRPRKVYVRDVWMRMHLEDICEKTGIVLDDESGVPLVDNFVGQMMALM